MGIEINQLEFRWTGDGQRGFSVVASSDPLDAERWGGRLGQLARPPVMNCPTSVIYQTFGAEAAIVFRHIIRPNTPPGPDPGRTDVNRGDGLPEPGRGALVARALVGPLELLGPDLALACAALGLPRFLTPALGEAQKGDQLPALLPEYLDLEARADWFLAQLDQSAQSDPALTDVVAAVLDRPGTALELQVPETQIGSSTASLLWGLWRITSPIFDDARNWTFSTGEPPSGNTDPGPLPQLVVRALRRPGDPRPAAQRTEMMVIQPRAVASETDRREAGSMAELLVTAYRRLPVPEFLGYLREARAAGRIPADRLAAIADRLHAFQPSRPDQPPAREGNQDQDQDQDQEEADEAIPFSPEPAAAPPARHRLRPPVKRHPAAMALGEDMVGRVLERLAHYDITATGDLLDMREQADPPGGDRRAFLRREATRHGWFVRQFTQQFPRDVEDVLRALFTLIVEPDMSDAARRPQLRDELSLWMRDERTPDVVLLALESLFWDRRDFEFRQLLLGITGVRWLADHGRYGQLMEPAQAARTAQHALPRARWWVPFKADSVPARVANIGACVVLAEAIIIALLAAGWL